MKLLPECPFSQRRNCRPGRVTGARIETTTCHLDADTGAVAPVA